MEVGEEMTKKTKHCRRAGDKMFDMRWPGKGGREYNTKVLVLVDLGDGMIV